MDPKKQEAIEVFREKQPEVRRYGDGLQVLENLESARLDAKIKAEERRDILRMRRSWSMWILVSILAIVAFDIFVVLALGFGWIQFQQDYILPTFIAESLLKIFGLALIVVKFLFNKEDLMQSEEPRPTIPEDEVLNT